MNAGRVRRFIREGFVAVAQINAHGAVGVRNDQVGLSISVEVPSREPGRTAATASRGLAACAREGSISSALEDQKTVRVVECDCQVEFAVGVEVGGCDRGWNTPGLRKRETAASREVSGAGVHED